MGKTKKLTTTAIIAAVTTVMLAVSGIVPSAALSLAALAGLIPAVLVRECGYGIAFAAYLIAGFLGIILLPDKSGAVLFVLLFGYYTIAKQWLESKLSAIPAWILKLIFANLVFFVLFFFFTQVFLAVVPKIFTVVWTTWLAYLAAFVVYDRAGTYWLAFYSNRIRR